MTVGIQVGAEWPEVPLGDILTAIESGKNLRCDERPPQSHEKGVVKISSVTWGAFDPAQSKKLPHDFKPNPQTLICNGDFLFSRANTIELVGACVIVDQAPHSLYLSDKVLRLRLPEDLKPWLLKFLKSPAGRARIEAASTGNQLSMRNISQNSIRALRVPLPHAAQRQGIVAKIDSLSAKSQRARDHLDHIPHLVAKYKQAILAGAFRGDLTRRRRQGPEEFAAHKIAEVRSERQCAELSQRRRAALSNLPARTPQLHELPATWAWVCIEELAADDNRAIQSGPFGSSLLHSEFEKIGYLVIGIDNVQEGSFSLGSQNRIGEVKFLELERFRARPYDVLVTVMATIGRTCVVPDTIEPAIITKHVYRVTVDNRLILPHYLMNALRGSEAVLEQMGANVRGQTRPGLNGTIIRSIFIPLAPLDEQIELLRIIDGCFSWIDRLAAEATNARKLIDHLDQAVLAKAFQGELVPQDPNDESATALSERIRAERALAAPSRNGSERKRRSRGE